MLLSLIIPIYNVELYIKECLESVICQLSESVEVILVNDGTLDNSMVIVSEILKALPEGVRSKFIIYEQNNLGLSAARNSGISIARGKYIAFLDSDDILLPNYFNILVGVIENNDVDIIQYKFKRFYGNICNVIPYYIYINNYGFFDLNKEILKVIFNANIWYAWSRVYRASLFEKNKFPENYNFEDAALVPYLFSESKTIFFLNKELYGYRDRPNSIVRSVDNLVIDKNIKSMEYVLDKFINEVRCDNLYFIPLIHFFKGYIDYSLSVDGLGITYKRWNKYSKKIKDLMGEKYLITKPATRLFSQLYFLGFISFFIVKFLAVSHRVLVDFKSRF